jgi:cleavage and polyadenylation specificity factor subunit 1
VLLLSGWKLAVIPLLAGRGGGGTAARFKSYVIDGAALSTPVTNIIDFELMHGYNEPTLAILHEPVATWVGRYARTFDTKRLVAVNLNMAAQEHPVIWNPDAQIPSDVNQIIAMPRPLAGILCVGANCVIYLDQSTRPYAVALNEHSGKSSFQYKQHSDYPLALDCSDHALLDPESILFTLKTGDLCKLTLVAEGRTLRKMKIENVGSSTLTSCMCKVGPSHLFLGSRLGDSVLLQFSKVNTAGDEDDFYGSGGGGGGGGVGAASASKRRRLSSTRDAGFEQFDDYNMYGDEADHQMSTVTAFEFAVSVRLWWGCVRGGVSRVLCMLSAFALHVLTDDFDCMCCSV